MEFRGIALFVYPYVQWNLRSQNLNVGDICLLLSYKGSAGKLVTYYKYCKVIELVPGSDGLVRRVIMKYHIPSAKSKQICVDVRRLVVLQKITDA